MNYFYRRELGGIAKQAADIRSNVAVLFGYLPKTMQLDEMQQDTTALHFVCQIVEANAKLIQHLRNIACFECGAAYYDYTHENQYETATTAILKQLTKGGGNV